MKYITNNDYDYIINKFHGRFVCHEEIYDEKTGLSTDEIAAGIVENDKKYRDLPHSIRKARAMEYVLGNTKIACDKRDRFPAICSMDRIIQKKLISVWHSETMQQLIPETARLLNSYHKLGIVRIGIDYDHSVPDWDRIFRYGFQGLIDEAEKARRNLAAGKVLSEEETAFYESIGIEYSAIIRLICRMAGLAKDENPRLSEVLYHLSKKPPETFYQCLLVSYIFFIIIEHIECMQARSLSIFDKVFYPYYSKDLENGISKDELHTDLAYYLLQFASIDNYWNQPVCLGGTKKDGTTEINQLSYDFLEVYDNMGIYNPKIQIKLSDRTPKSLVLKALEMIRHGNNSLVFVCEETARKALLLRGATEDEAREFSVHGCYEYSIKYTVPLASIYLNLLKPLEYTLNGGYDGVTKRLTALETSTEFKTFDDFYKTYYKQLQFCLDKIKGIVDSITQYNAHINPQPMLSATYQTAIDRGLDALNGGAAGTYANINGGFLANAADSLTAIKELVFDKKEYSIKELQEILDNNFEGYESLRQRILNQIDHYGNNREVPDRFAKEITSYIADFTLGIKNIHGGRINFGVHVARMSYDVASSTAASPDGRKRGEELSKNASASMGRNKDGVTAAILSATKLETIKFGANSCLDLGIHPSAVKGEDGLEIMYTMLMTFEKLNGFALQINVFDADTLRDAQKHPEKYDDLQIRVCGWNVLFNNINKEEQDGFIRQAEALI